VFRVGDKLQLQSRFFLCDRWHIFQTLIPENNSPLFSSSKQILMFRDPINPPEFN